MVSQRSAGVALGYANIVVKNLVNLVYTPMLLAFVGQADYGVFQTSNSFVFSLSVLSFGFSDAYIRFYTQRRVSGDELGVRRLNGMYLAMYALVSSVALVLGLLFAASAPTVFAGSFTPGQVELAGRLMAIMAFSVAATLLSTVFDAYIVAHERFSYRQSRQMATTLLTPVAALALLRLGMGAVGVALAQLSVNLLLLAINARYAISGLGMRFDVSRFDGRLFGAVAAFSAWLFVNQLCELANQSLPNVFLGALSSAVSVSVYAVSVQVRSVFYSLSTTISGVFVPEINRIVASSDDNCALTDLMSRVGRLQAVLYVYVLGGFVLLGRHFIKAWAGDVFADAYYLVLAMVIPLFVPLVQNTGIEIQRAKNRHRARSVSYLCMAVANVAVTVALAPSLGYWAPAIGYVVYIVLGSGLFMNWYYHTRIGLDMARFWRRVLPVPAAGALATLLCIGGSSLLPVTDWLRFVLWGLCYSALYLFVVYRVVMSEAERLELRMRLRRS